MENFPDQANREIDSVPGGKYGQSQSHAKFWLIGLGMMLAVIFVGISVWWVSTRLVVPNPTYQGKRLDQWLADYTKTNGSSISFDALLRPDRAKTSRLPYEAELRVFLDLGTNALPFLGHVIGADTSGKKLRDYYTWFWAKAPKWLRSHLRAPIDYRQYQANAVRLIGVIAQSMKGLPAPVRESVLRPYHDKMLAILKLTDVSLQGNAVMALGQIGLDPVKTEQVLSNLVMNPKVSQSGQYFAGLSLVALGSPSAGTISFLMDVARTNADSNIRVVNYIALSYAARRYPQVADVFVEGIGDTNSMVRNFVVSQLSQDLFTDEQLERMVPALEKASREPDNSQWRSQSQAEGLLKTIREKVAERDKGKVEVESK